MEKIARLYLLLCNFFPNGLVHKIIYRVVRPLFVKIKIPYRLNDVNFLLRPIGYIDSKLLLGEPFDSEVLNLINGLQPGQVFIDIGANFGLFSLLAAGKGAYVLSFEPSTRELRSFYKNLELNIGLAPLVRVIPMAAGKQANEFLNLTYGPISNTGTNHISSNELCDEKVPVVEVMSLLSDFYTRNIKIIKIDVEGFEFNVVSSLEPLLARLNEIYVVCEINDNLFDSVKVYQIFAAYGYEIQNKECLQYQIKNVVFYKKSR